MAVMDLAVMDMAVMGLAVMELAVMGLAVMGLAVMDWPNRLAPAGAANSLYFPACRWTCCGHL